jgi:glycosyltransferase involved in cell wall biosynthesis
MNNLNGEYHILIISNGFPNYFNQLDGIFYFDQAKALKQTFPNLKIGFLSVNPVGVKDFLRRPNIFKLGSKTFLNSDVEFNVLHYLNLPFINNFDVKMTCWLIPKLFKRYITKFGKPQIIHVHGFEAGKASIEIKNKYQIPFVITEHSSKFINNKLTIEQRQIANDVFKNSSHNIAVSNYFARRLESMFNVPFVTIPNMVKTNEIISEDNVTKQYKIISIGTFNDNKNQILLLQALAKHRFGKILLVGKGPNETTLRSFAKDNNLEKDVDFLPFQPRKELFKLIKQAFCLAITSHHETFGVVAIEAMACGVPVISTKAGGPSDIVINDFNGYITESNPDSFYEAYCKVSENLVKFAPMTLKDYVEKHFSEKAISMQLLTAYKIIIK